MIGLDEAVEAVARLQAEALADEERAVAEAGGAVERAARARREGVPSRVAAAERRDALAAVWPARQRTLRLEVALHALRRVRAAEGEARA